MTVQEAKDRVISLAQSQVGTREGENNWNKYAAELDPLSLTWGSKQNQPWCGEFVLWLFYKAFGVDTGLKMLYSTKPSGIPLCSAGADYFKNAGKFYNSPELGDIIFFYYSGGINHTGIVVGVSGGVVTTVEGNSSDKVSRNSYSAGSTIIAGYGRPNYVLVANVAHDTQPDTVETPRWQTCIKVTAEYPQLMNGDKGEAVRFLQTILPFHSFRYKCGVYGADGDFGPATQNAVERFQKDKGLVVDSIVGEATWAALLKV